MKIKLFTKKYPQEGDLKHTYSPLKNMILEDNSVGNFDTTELSVNLNNPLNIECQPSYDGTVNLIMNDDINPPRIINSRFTKLEDNRFKVVNRNQTEQTNLYKSGEIDLSTRLFRTINKIPRLDFAELNYYGQLKGGNYTFYIKYADSDYNKTDIVCESGQVCIFKGNLFNINSISGTLQDERTNKAIKLILNNIDETFSKFYILYSREYSDTNGFKMTEFSEIIEPYEITGSSQEIIINGFEETNLIAPESLNIQYNYVTNVKTQAQVQNMLFFGNIENTNIDVKNLQNISYFFNVKLSQKNKTIGWIDPVSYKSKEEDIDSLEYYDPKNIYYNLGYWPDEVYRLGVVYIMNDDSLSPVFNLRGCEFPNMDYTNTDGSSIQYKKWDSSTRKWITNYIERDEFLTAEPNLANTFGVFKNPVQSKNCFIQDYAQETIKPWFYKITIPKDLKFTHEDKTLNVNLFDELRKFGVKGFFFVRQKRIPSILCQGVSIGIEEESALPTLWDPIREEYFAESFLSQGTGNLDTTYENRKTYCNTRKGSALLSVDASVNPELQSTLDGSSFLLQQVNNARNLKQNNRRFIVNFTNKDSINHQSAKCIYIQSDTPYKYVDGFGFSTRAGCAESVKDFSFFGKEINDKIKYDKDNRKLIRGVFSPYIGVCANLENNCIYNIKPENYSSQYMKDYFGIRRDDNSPFYAISDRFELNENNNEIDVYRGDCFTNTVTLRLHRNFVDPDYPVSDTIVDPNTWVDHYGGYLETPSEDKDDKDNDQYNWARINRGDINAVPLGTWVTYKCLSNYNLGLRSEDRSYVDETALMGNPRSFYPLNGASVRAANKVNESWILNKGYSSTVGQKTEIVAPNVPYIKDIFDNRIMFSNIQVEGDFKNGYRIFQGLSYEDIDNQYGTIVKLIPWGVNLLCVFEHGIGVVPINEKALIQTATEQSVHMYGAGVLQKQVSLVTPDFGSIWPESIIRTPIGVYGVDTTAKSIWRYSDKKGFETISDMKIQRFLNDNIKLNESDKYPMISLKNVKTHYNNYKGDVMFTFYNFVENVEWNFCFNERLDKWITRYSWTPLYSENINNIFYSLDKKRSEILGYIYDNENCTYGIQTDVHEWGLDGNNNLLDAFETNIELKGVTLATGFTIKINSLVTSYLKDNIEEKIILDSETVSKIIKIRNTNNPLIKTLSWNKSDFESIFKQYDISYKVPLYYIIDVTICPEVNGDQSVNLINKVIGIVVDNEYASDEYNDLLCNGFYVHGRAGIFDEIDYNDQNENNQIKPTYWYNKQEPFEFEFVVSEPIGLHKIFENLVIISNKAQPNSIEVEIIGDVYDFKKSGLLGVTEFKDDKTTIKYDPILNQNTLITEQECKNIEKVGRRLGNIHYKEDSWYLTIEPIKFKNSKNPEWSSARIRDKFAKIRIKYSGEDQVLITAIKTLTNLTSS